MKTRKRLLASIFGGGNPNFAEVDPSHAVLIGAWQTSQPHAQPQDRSEEVNFGIQDKSGLFAAVGVDDDDVAGLEDLREELGRIGLLPVTMPLLELLVLHRTREQPVGGDVLTGDGDAIDAVLYPVGVVAPEGADVMLHHGLILDADGWEGVDRVGDAKPFEAFDKRHRVFIWIELMEKKTGTFAEIFRADGGAFLLSVEERCEQHGRKSGECGSKHEGFLRGNRTAP